MARVLFQNKTKLHPATSPDLTINTSAYKIISITLNQNSN